ncbi:dipeptidase [Swingsia samuiensis]|uniref:Membrane dipeptidase n=1 Tax=Swingsia samuiensis TaxID=1293412 RepID=A0A4Y6UP02_9PROT|nr:dipeptidase [Swingsia samuiensis]QDH18081.1 membrane dipeptidase [Swingsia samuiensis]
MIDLHDTLLTFDTHIDIPWPDQNDAWTENTSRKFDTLKAHKGGLKAVCLAAYIPQGSRDENGHEEAWQRVQAMLDVITRLNGKKADIQAKVCHGSKDIKKAVEAGSIAIVPAIENGYALGDKPERIEFLAQKYGVRYMTLTHNGHNLLADAAIARSDLNDASTLHGGLSALGKKTIQIMNKHGVLVDVSHAAKSTMMQASEISEVPIFASHSCVRTLCDHPRNLDDEQLDRLKETGGLIQITAMSPFLRKGGGATTTDLAQHVAYVADRIGVEHVGVSSDFDGGGGIEGWQSALETPNVTLALEKIGFNKDDISKIWGGNMLKLLNKSEEMKV